MIEDHHYRTPRELEVTAAAPQRVLLIGSCLMAEWPATIGGIFGGAIDYMPFAGVTRLPDPIAPVAEYDFQVVQINLRHIWREWLWYRLGNDEASWCELYYDVCAELETNLKAAMRLNEEHGLLTFVQSFIVPQQNPMGRLLPRHDYRNVQYFVEALNERLGFLLEKYQNVHYFDADNIVQTFGRRYFQDDVAWQSNHSSSLNNFDLAEDRDRLEPVTPMTTLYRISAAKYVMHFWSELVAMWRTIRRLDEVKLVIVDLDDTIWRGVQAEQGLGTTIEGYPLGLLEALAHLKRRGVLLAIVSKNDDATAVATWERVVSNRVLDIEADFVARRINWAPKSENVAEIIALTNLLPKSVVFIDDNPRERAEVAAAFPEIRMLADPYTLKRVLCWAPETQVAAITDESATRTTMGQAQIEREHARASMSPAEFLATLDVVATMQPDPNFVRVIELLNKTNQFNTTGKRWTKEELGQYASRYNAGRILAFSVSDRFTSYGLVAVVLVSGIVIDQMVMSCRVFGLGVEQLILDGLRGMKAAYVPTEHNHICHATIEAFNACAS